METKYVAYYRVSTKKQGNNHSLEAQKNEVHRIIGTENIISEFTDIESGKNVNRKGLQKAIKICKLNDYTLVSFRLDRLTRNLKTIIQLQENEIKYTALDCFHDSQMIIEIKTSINQDFLRQLSDKTKAGLKVARSKGKIIGSPQNLTDKAKKKGLKIRKENSLRNENNIKGYELIRMYLKDSLTWAKIAEKLNEKGFKAARGGELSVIQVQRMFNKFNKQK